MPNPDPIVILVELRAKSRHEDHVKREASAIFERIRREEPGCDYIVGHQDVTDPTRFMFFEIWRDDQQFQEFHTGRDYMTEYFARLDQHLEHRGFTRWTRFA